MSEEKITSLTFWFLVIAVWLLSQAPAVQIPINFMGTWVHELGHGLGALVSGGEFDRMIISRDFSGVAYTATYGPGGRMIVLIAGLLAPALAGAFMLILVRGFGRSSWALTLLSLSLLVSGTIWAGDMFTRLTVLGTGVLILLIALKGPSAIRAILAQIIAISFAISAVAHIDYFFMRGGQSGGQPIVSDTTVLSDLTGLPHLMLAGIITFLSLLILFIAFRLSEALWKRRSARERRKTGERRSSSERRNGKPL